MRFLEAFWRTLLERWARPAGERTVLPSPPERAEPLSRYLLSKREFHRARRTVNASAFVPGADGRKSVFRTLGLAEVQIWDLGERAVVRGSRRVHARADVTVGDVGDAGIALEPDPPPSRHADLVGWPAEDSARLLAATELAEAAELHLNPSVYPS